MKVSRHFISFLFRLDNKADHGVAQRTCSQLVSVPQRQAPTGFSWSWWKPAPRPHLTLPQPPFLCFQRLINSHCQQQSEEFFFSFFSFTSFSYSFVFSTFLRPPATTTTTATCFLAPRPAPPRTHKTLWDCFELSGGGRKAV